MGKRTVYTKITPLPSNIPRQLALDMLHSHSEVIQLNPLVTGVKSIDAPRDAASDEFFSQWYEISEIITWGFGMKKKISFRGVFHDQPWGMQSHVYAPMGVDMRNKYRIGGNQPGEPRETRELGIDTPADGLYMREDVEIICAVPLTSSFVKKEAKAATAIMIDRMVRKAELLDEGKLHAMFEDGRMKTSKPSQQATFTDNPLPSPSSLPSAQPPGSPGMRSDSSFSSPALDQKGFGRYHDVAGHHPSQRNSYVPQYQQTGYSGPGLGLVGMPEIAEMPGSFYQPEKSPSLCPQPLKPQGQTFRAELPGDSSLAPPQPSAPYQAYQQPQSSPQPSPALPNRQHSNSSSNYKVSNPDVPVHPAHRHHSAQSGQVAEWQRGISANSSEDPNSIRHSRTSWHSSEPDHQRFSQASIQQTPVQQLPHDPSGKGVGHLSKCPVCSLFEGDEAAVSHHVSRAHFA